MKEIIDHILAGNFHCDNGSLEFSRAKVEITILPGESYEGSFTVSGSDERYMEGSVFTSDSRMECLCSHFTGNGDEIGFVFHSKGMEAGDVLKGNFYLVSNQGEYALPFSVMIVYPMLDSDIGNVKNLFHFANYAKSDWQEAVRLFYDPAFQRIFRENGDTGFYLYQGLSQYAMNERNVDEFLIAIQKKQKTVYQTDVEKIRVDAAGELARQELVLTRNGWGYTSLQAELAGGFLMAEESLLGEDDFLGNRCTFYFYIDKSKLHAGINYGSIRFCNSFTEVSVPVEVTVDISRQKELSVHLERQKTLYRLTRSYIDFRMKRILRKTWMDQTTMALKEMTQLDENDPIPGLFLAQLLMTEERTNEAGWTLEHAKAMLLQSDNSNPAVWDYYLYLTTLFRHDGNYVNQIANEVEDTYKQHPDNWRLAWLLLYLSENLNVSAASRWLFLQEQYEHGCCSPVIYVEGWLMLKADPSLFMNLGPFEIQVLNFAAKNKLLTREIVRQLHYLTTRTKEFYRPLYHILQIAYEMYQDAETLQTICSFLIQKNQHDPSCFYWYAKGVEENIRITRLYEYYMYSLDLTWEIQLPKVIFMYFAYHNTLNYEYTAFLYADLMRRKEELQDIFDNVQFQIQNFVMDMLRKKKINKHLAYLYENVVDIHMMDKEIREALADLYFTRQITVADERYKKVIVLQPELAQEKSYPIQNRQALVICFEEDALLFLEDEAEGRDIPDEFCKIERLMKSGSILKDLAANDFEHLGLQIYLCNRDNEEVVVTDENARRYAVIGESNEVNPDFRQNVIMGQLRFYQTDHRETERDALLEKLDPEMFHAGNRACIIGYLIEAGKNDKALSWIKKYGFLHVEALSLARLASQMISTGHVAQDQDMQMKDLLLRICHAAFEQNQFDDLTLQYLMDHYEGYMKKLRDIWKKGIDHHKNVHNISERMLIQMLYTGSFVGEKMAIFCSYINGGADIALEKAFLSQCSFDYFVRDRLTDSIVFEELERLTELGEEIHKVGKLSCVKFYAEHSLEITDREKKILERYLTELMEDNIYLPFFGNYVGMIPFMKRFQDKTVIEYKTSPDAKVMIHYMLEQHGSGTTDYRSHEMNNVYGGVYTAQFVLFFGDNLLYYITEEKDGKQELTESGSVSRSDMGSEADNSRFNMLNDIIISETLQDYETMNALLEAYMKTDFLQKRLFYIRD